MKKLEIKDVTFAYLEDKNVLKNINLSFEDQVSTAIIGQNGSGKTTLMKLINGLLSPNSGEIVVDGESNAGKTTAQISRKVGYIFQNPDDQIFHDVVYEEIAYGPVKMGFDNEKRKKMIKWAVNLCELEDHINEHPYSLSFSIRKFISIASVLAIDTDVIIFDEPTACQDDHSIKLLTKIIKELEALKKTVIVITHDMQFVSDTFTNVIVMTNGSVISEGTPREIFWDFDVLKQASLDQPPIAALANNLRLENIMSIDEMI